MGFPVSPAIANIYMEYFEELALGAEYPVPAPWWKRYADNVISIVKKEQVDILFNHLNSVNCHIKLTLEAHGNGGSI